MRIVNDSRLGDWKYRQTVTVEAEISRELGRLSFSEFDDVILMAYHKCHNTRRIPDRPEYRGQPENHRGPENKIP